MPFHLEVLDSLRLDSPSSTRSSDRPGAALSACRLARAGPAMPVPDPLRTGLPCCWPVYEPYTRSSYQYNSITYSLTFN